MAMLNDMKNVMPELLHNLLFRVLFVERGHLLRERSWACIIPPQVCSLFRNTHGCLFRKVMNVIKMNVVMNVIK